MSRTMLTLSALGAANAAGKLLWALSLALIMRYLGPRDYGVLVTLWSAAGLVAAATDLGLGQLLLREGARRPALAPLLLRRALGWKLALSAVAVGAGMLLVKAGILPWPSANIALAGVVLAAPLLDHFFTIATVASQLDGRLRSFALWRMASFMLLLAGVVVVIRLDAGMPAMGIAWLCASIAGLGALGMHLRGSMRRAHAATVLPNGTYRSALPFLVIGLLALAYGRADVTLLGSLDGPASAGRYHAAYQVILLVFSIPELLFTVVYPALYRLHGQTTGLDLAWTAITRWQVVIAVAVAPVLMVFGTDVVTLIGGNGFAGAGPILSSLALMVLALPLSSALHFLVVTDRVRTRTRIELGVVLASASAVAICALHGRVQLAALLVSVIYVGGCLVAWACLRRAGYAMRLAVVPVSKLVVALPLLAVLFLPLHWLACSALYAVTVLALALTSGFVGPHDFDALLEARTDAADA
jgi:O-antigen/teichoic acid export membrane protein